MTSSSAKKMLEFQKYTSYLTRNSVILFNSGHNANNRYD